MENILVVPEVRDIEGWGSRAETYSDGTLLCVDCGGCYSEKVVVLNTQNIQSACITGKI